MKRQILFFLLLPVCFCGLAQTENLEGKWKGYITLDTSGFQQVIEFGVQFRQSGKAVWGIYIRGGDTVFNSADCTGKLIARLDDKDNSVITIYQDGVESNHIPLAMCSYLNILEAIYSKEEGVEFLKGRWFSEPGSRLGLEGAAGRFRFEKVSPVPDIEVDKYFPNLSRLIKKFNNH